MLKNELRILRNKIQTLRSESQETNESQKTNKLRAFNKELHRKMINTMKKVLLEFVCKKYNTGIVNKDEIILKSEQTKVKRHNKDITENVSMINIRRKIITLKSVQLTNVYRERKHIEEQNSIIMCNNEIILKSVQIIQNENSKINTEETNIMTVCDNKILFESQKNRNDQYETSTEEVKTSKACKNERYWLLNMIIGILHENVKEECRRTMQIKTTTLV